MGGGHELTRTPWTSLVEGGDAVHDWFGHAPRFHDAAIIACGFERHARTFLRIHVCRMLDETDTNGLYKSDRHAVIEIDFHRVNEIDVRSDPADAEVSIIGRWTLAPVHHGIEASWTASYGLEGRIVAARVSLTLKPDQSLQ